MDFLSFSIVVATQNRTLRKSQLLEVDLVLEKSREGN